MSPVYSDRFIKHFCFNATLPFADKIIYSVLLQIKRDKKQKKDLVSFLFLSRWFSFLEIKHLPAS
jgi:hypothetical protein